MVALAQTGRFVSQQDGKRYVVSRRETAAGVLYYVYRVGAPRAESRELQQIIDLLGYEPDFRAIPANTLPTPGRE